MGGLTTREGGLAALVYYGSGYIPTKDYWRLGAIFGVIFFVVLLMIGLPWIAMIR
jgi:L-tartrate/succinate antiporter